MTEKAKLEFLSERLKEKRFAHRLSQQQVADCLGIERGLYCRYETGVELPTEKILNKLAKVFKVEAAQLLP